MNKRDFLKTAGIIGAGIMISPVAACSPGKKENSGSVTPETPAGGVPVEFTLPPLGYAFNALEPAIDALTMEIHHGKHHAAYVTNLNKALTESGKYPGMDIEALLASVKPEDAAIRNNGGGHWNHSMFWKWIAPGGAKQPSGNLNEAINSAFGNFEEFKKQFSEAGKTRFGSGWAWLNVGPDKKLFISSTPNQDNPLMKNIAEKTGTPVLGLDVWEHAYYLKHQNKRPDYIAAFFEVINWDFVGERFSAAL